MQAFDQRKRDDKPPSPPTHENKPAYPSDLTSNSTSAFGVVMSEMGSMRELHTEICQNLISFADFVANGNYGDDTIEALQKSVSELSCFLSRYQDILSSTSAQDRLHKVEGELSAIDDCGQILNAIASLMGTTVASLGLKNLEGFIEELRETSKNIQLASGDVFKHVARLKERNCLLLDKCKKASKLLDDISLRLSSSRKRVSILNEAEAKASQDLGQRARALTRDGYSQLKSFITAMQFSDRLAQRLDHLEMMLLHSNGHVARLGAAHARRCATDVTSISVDVRETIRLLAELGHSGARVFSEGNLADTISKALAARKDLTNLVTRELSSIQSVVETARSEVEYAATMAEATTKSFDGLKLASKNLTLASFNSMLVSNRYSRACGPMKVLSKEVRQIASDTLTAVDNAQGAIRKTATGSSEHQNDLFLSANSLNEEIESFHRQTETGEQRLAKINAMRESSSACARSLLLMVDTVTKSMDRVDETAEQLTALADHLDARAKTGEALDTDIINTIWRSYTMEEERIVHAEVFAGVPGLDVDVDVDVGSTQTVTDDEDIDDMLF